MERVEKPKAPEKAYLGSGQWLQGKEQEKMQN